MTMKNLAARLETRWLLWRVVIPLLGPIIISLLVILAWTSGRPDFKPSLGIVVDVSPWALTFYALTLIGSTLNELWPKLSSHTTLGIALVVVAFAVALYAAFMVIWRHDPNFVPGRQVYGVALLLLLVAVVLCHTGYKKRS